MPNANMLILVKLKFIEEMFFPYLGSQIYFKENRD